MKINMKILLVCNAGMSTGIMKMKLEQEAKTRGLDASEIGRASCRERV